MSKKPPSQKPPAAPQAGDLDFITVLPKSGSQAGGPGPAHLLLAHGAGQQMTSPFFETVTSLIVERGVGVTRFEFAYMAQRRHGGKRRPPPRADVLTTEYMCAVAQIREQLGSGTRLLIGGKSMGGRMASMIADELYETRQISGLICLGYPFHPPGNPDKLRTDHLEDLACPTLIVQGERDPFGTRADVESYQLSKAIEVKWATDGDHDLGPRGGKGVSRKDNLKLAADAIAAFASRAAGSGKAR